MIEKSDLVELFTSFGTIHIGLLEKIIYSPKNPEEISEVILWVPTWLDTLEQVGFIHCTDLKKIDLESLKQSSWGTSIVAGWIQKLTPVRGLTSPYPIVRDWAKKQYKK